MCEGFQCCPANILPNTCLLHVVQLQLQVSAYKHDMLNVTTVTTAAAAATTTTTTTITSI